MAERKDSPNGSNFHYLTTKVCQILLTVSNLQDISRHTSVSFMQEEKIVSVTCNQDAIIHIRRYLVVKLLESAETNSKSLHREIIKVNK